MTLISRIFMLMLLIGCGTEAPAPAPAESSEFCVVRGSWFVCYRDGGSTELRRMDQVQGYLCVPGAGSSMSDFELRQGFFPSVEVGLEL